MYVWYVFSIIEIRISNVEGSTKPVPKSLKRWKNNRFGSRISVWIGLKNP